MKNLLSRSSEDPLPEKAGNFFQDEEAEILYQVPTDKHSEVKQWFSQRRSANLAPEAFKKELENFKEVVEYFLQSLKRVEKTLGTKDVSQEMKDFFYRAFSSKCDLVHFSIEDLRAREKRFADHWDQFWTMRERVKDLTGEGTQFQTWLEEEWKKPNFSMTKLLESLWDKYHELQQKLQQEYQEIEMEKNALRSEILSGLFNETDKKRWQQRIDDCDKKGIKKLRDWILNIKSKRETIVTQRFEKVQNNLDNPLEARNEMRKLRQQYGWGVFEFLKAEEFWGKLNEIALLQKKETELLQQKERAQMDLKSRDEELKKTQSRLATLTGKIQSEESAGQDFHAPKLDSAESKESIQLKLEALRSLKNVLYKWFQGAQKCLASKEEDSEETRPIDVFEIPSRYAWLGDGDNKILYLKKTFDPQTGENLYKKYQRLDAASPSTWAETPGTKQGTFRGRTLVFEASDFTDQNAQKLIENTRKINQEPEELFFLAGQFILDQDKNKINPPSAPKEVLERCEQKISELSQKLQDL